MPKSFRVASFNINKGIGVDGELDLRRTANVVQKTNADIVGFQEVDRHFREQTTYTDQVETLVDELGMNIVYGPAIEKPATVESNGNPREYGVAIATHFPIEGSDEFFLYQRGDSEPRILLKTTIDIDGSLVDVYNTHLSLEQSVRKKQGNELAEIVNGHDGNTVLTGDLNAVETSHVIQTVSNELEDVFRGERDAETFPTPPLEDRSQANFLRDISRRCRIDYIFCSPDLEATDACVYNSKASDHSAIAATVHLNST